MRESKKKKVGELSVLLGGHPPNSGNEKEFSKDEMKKINRDALANRVGHLLLEKVWVESQWLPPEIKEQFFKFEIEFSWIAKNWLEEISEDEFLKIIEPLFLIGFGWIMPLKPPGLFSKSNKKNYKTKIKISKIRTAIKAIKEASDFIQTETWIGPQLKLRSKLSSAAASSFGDGLAYMDNLWNKSQKNEAAHIETITIIVGEKTTMKFLKSLKETLKEEEIKLNGREQNWEKRSNISRTRLIERKGKTKAR